MATIQSSVRLFDGMTPNRRKLANALNTVITSFESIENAYNNPFDMEALCAAQRELIEARADIDQLEEALGKAREKEEQLDNRTRPGLIKLAICPTPLMCSPSNLGNPTMQNAVFFAFYSY